jgi:hypothetical protein
MPNMTVKPWRKIHDTNEIAHQLLLDTYGLASR